MKNEETFNGKRFETQWVWRGRGLGLGGVGLVFGAERGGIESKSGFYLPLRGGMVYTNGT